MSKAMSEEERMDLYSTPAELRAEIARRRATLYVLAAEVGIYPGRLGQMLNERVAMPDAVARKLSVALDKFDRSQGRHTDEPRLARVE